MLSRIISWLQIWMDVSVINVETVLKKGHGKAALNRNYYGDKIQG